MSAFQNASGRLSHTSSLATKSTQYPHQYTQKPHFRLTPIEYTDSCYSQGIAPHFPKIRRKCPVYAFVDFASVALTARNHRIAVLIVLTRTVFLIFAPAAEGAVELSWTEVAGAARCECLC